MLNKPMLICAILAGLSMPVLAAEPQATATPEQPIKLNMKPGLWQTTVNMNGGGLDPQAMAQIKAMQQQMQQMPPQQRQMMEQMLAATGTSLDGDTIVLNHGKTRITGDEMVNKSCVTQEQIDNGAWNSMDKCQMKVTPIGKDHYKTKQQCSNEMGNMEAEVKFESPEKFTGTGQATHNYGGKTQTIDIKLQGKWLGKDCADIMPTTNAHSKS